MRTAAIFLLFIFLVCCNRSVPAVTDPPTDANALLWKVYKPGWEDTSYIFGTIHMIEAEKFVLPSPLLEAFSKSEEVFFEVNLEEAMSDENLLNMIGSVVMLGTSLRDLISKEDYEKVLEVVEPIGLPPFIIDHIKPFFLMALIESGGEFSLDEDEIRSYELELMDLAKNSAKEVGGLETIHDQLELTEKITLEDQAKMLVSALNAMDANDQLNHLSELYLSQNIYEMYDLIISDPISKKYLDALIHDRNKSWITVIENNWDKPTLYAVGAGHLAGEEGVLELLREEGFRVIPVEMNMSQKYMPVNE